MGLLNASSPTLRPLAGTSSPILSSPVAPSPTPSPAAGASSLSPTAEASSPGPPGASYPSRSQTAKASSPSPSPTAEALSPSPTAEASGPSLPMMSYPEPSPTAEASCPSPSIFRHVDIGILSASSKRLRHRLVLPGQSGVLGHDRLKGLHKFRGRNGGNNFKLVKCSVAAGTSIACGLWNLA